MFLVDREMYSMYSMYSICILYMYSMSSMYVCRHACYDVSMDEDLESDEDIDAIAVFLGRQVMFIVGSKSQNQG